MSVLPCHAVRLAHVEEVFTQPRQGRFRSVPFSAPDRVVSGDVKRRGLDEEGVEVEHIVRIGQGEMFHSEIL